MIQGMRILVAACVVLLMASACGGRMRPNFGPPPAPTDRENNIRLMLSYDGNSDGKVSREELEQGLKRQFDACDLNHDGILDAMEIAIENDRRYKAAGTGFSPLIDWNQDGRVDFAEFATTAHSVFAELDANHDGMLEGGELRVPRMRQQGPQRGRRAGSF